MTRRVEAPQAQPKFVRRIQGGHYEYGHILLGEDRTKDKYVRVGIVGTYDEAANASEFQPAAPHRPWAREYIL